MSNIKVYNITIPITSDELVFQLRGDQHYGVDRVDYDDMMKVLKEEQDKHRGNLFVADSGDITENHLVNSVGHGYDIKIKDPQKQLDFMRDRFIELNKHLHGEKAWNDLRINKKNLNNVRHVGVIGNHEYRTRKTAGLWAQRAVFDPSKTLDMDIQGLIKLKLINKKLKMSREYSIYLAHRPKNSNGTAVESIIRNCRAKRGDIPADIYAYGHYHKRVVFPDYTYDDKGRMKKVLYVVNPSPLTAAEYADWYGFSPISTGWFVNIYLPLDPNKFPYGKV